MSQTCCRHRRHAFMEQDTKRQQQHDRCRPSVCSIYGTRQGCSVPAHVSSAAQSARQQHRPSIVASTARACATGVSAAQTPEERTSHTRQHSHHGSTAPQFGCIGPYALPSMSNNPTLSSSLSVNHEPATLAPDAWRSTGPRERGAPSREQSHRPTHKSNQPRCQTPRPSPTTPHCCTWLARLRACGAACGHRGHTSGMTHIHMSRIKCIARQQSAQGRPLLAAWSAAFMATSCLQAYYLLRTRTLLDAA